MAEGRMRLRRIDTHAHVNPAPYMDELRRLDLVPSYPLPPATPDVLDESMRHRSIDAAVVSLSHPESGSAIPASRVN